MEVYGRTRNAYDPERMVGGSTGGEGCIVSSGASPFGLGSDIGGKLRSAGDADCVLGSIRLPAYFNGVFGHKPTGGLVTNVGQYPGPIDSFPEGSPKDRYCCTGPLARRAEDLYPLLRILAGPDNAKTIKVYALEEYEHHTECIAGSKDSRHQEVASDCH